MKATFLKADVPLTKTFYLKNDQIQKIGHPRIINYTSFEEEFKTLEDFKKLLQKHADLGHCLLKGNLTRALVNESRAGATDPNQQTRILLLDLDGHKRSTIKELLTFLKMNDIDYIIQYSSSMGVIPERGISAHIFILLDKDYAPALLKQWLMHTNFNTPALRAGINLTRTNNALRWPLDITTCQNDKLIYIAPPILKSGVKDEFKGERITLVKRKNRTASLGDIIPSAEANRLAMEEVLNELRLAANLPKRTKTTFKTAHNVEYLSKPDTAIVTGIKKDRGFVYLNINGGDSWGYYHPENNPQFIFNFKNEPPYKTSELLPDYWSEVRVKINETKIARDGKVYLAFRDFKTAKYYNGTFIPETQELDLAEARSEKQLHDYLQQYKQPIGDYIPDWNQYFNPQDGIICDLENKRINQFQPSQYMKLKHKEVKEIPPLIRKIAMHAVGDNEEFFEWFMNWCACIVQHRCKTGTAPVLHGTQGTGKTMFLNDIMAPIIGRRYAFSKRMGELEGQFNGWMENCLLVWIDEAQVSSYKNQEKLSADLKTFITDSPISIRNMYQMPYMAKNFTNMVLPSNKLAVDVDTGDRRYSIATNQETRLILTDAEYDQAIGSDVTLFYHYLMTRKADRAIARTALANAAKAQMTLVSQKAIDVACQALLTGNYAFFDGERPQDSDLVAMPAFAADAANRYNALLEQIKKNPTQAMTREELHTLLNYTIGDMPTSPYKFTSLLKHHKIHIQPITKDGKTTRGLKISWKLTN